MTKPPIWPRRPAVRPAAQLEAVVLDPDRADRLAVLLVEERVGALLDGLGHRQERDRHRAVVADDAADLVLDGALLVVGQRPIEREVEAQVVGRHERPGLAGRLADDVAQRPVEQVRAGVVAHRVGAPLGVDDGLDGLADAQPAVERAAMDDQPADRLLRVLDREQLAAAARLADRALVADLAAALGVERRPVEDDLGRAVAGELVELHAVADDRDDPALGGRGLVAQELGVAVRGPGSRCTARSARRAWRARPSCPTGCARAARRGRPGTRRGRRVNPYSAASSTVRSTGKPYVSWSRKATSPSSTGASAGSVLGPASDDALGRRASGRVADGLVEQLRAGIEGPGELGLLAQDRGQDRLALLDEVRVGLRHRVDHDRPRSRP